jgi:hypothetical protein
MAYAMTQALTTTGPGFAIFGPFCYHYLDGFIWVGQVERWVLGDVPADRHKICPKQSSSLILRIPNKYCINQLFVRQVRACFRLISYAGAARQRELQRGP